MGRSGILAADDDARAVAVAGTEEPTSYSRFLMARPPSGPGCIVADRPHTAHVNEIRRTFHAYGSPRAVAARTLPWASLFFFRHSRLCDPSHTCTEARPDKIGSIWRLRAQTRAVRMRRWRRDRRICEDHHATSDSASVQARLKDICVTVVDSERRSSGYQQKFVASEIEKWAGSVNA